MSIVAVVTLIRVEDDEEEDEEEEEEDDDDEKEEKEDYILGREDGHSLDDVDDDE